MSRINHKENKLQCSRCGEWKPKVKDFYMSQSKMYENNDKRIPLCKICLNERYEELYEKYNDEMKAMHHWCVNFDVYFSEANFESAFSQAGRDGNVSIIGIYMKNANSMKQNKGKTSLHSEIIVNQVEEIKENKKINTSSEEIAVTPSIKRRWGRGYTDEEYIELEYFFEDYYENLNHENNYMKLELIREMCTIKLIRDQAQRTKDFKTAREYSDLLSKKMADANLKPSQQKVLGEASDDIFGVRLRIYEQEEPVPEIQESLKDVDKFWKYHLKYLVKPFAMAMDLAKGTYSIDDGDNIEIGSELSKHMVEDNE